MKKLTSGGCYYSYCYCFIILFSLSWNFNFSGFVDTKKGFEVVVGFLDGEMSQ